MLFWINLRTDIDVSYVFIDRYKQAPRQIWKLRNTDIDVAGYVRVYKNLVQVGVRGGGHILPYDQPERAWQLVDMFISGFHPENQIQL